VLPVALNETWLDAVDAVIAERHLLKHPFYKAWSHGTLPAASLRHYAREYHHHVLAFPTYLSALHSRLPRWEDRQVVLENLIEEDHGPRNHPALWRQFAAAVGVTAEELRDVAPSAATAASIARFHELGRQAPVTAGLASLYAYESITPAVSTEKLRGLQQYYGVGAGAGSEFFALHATLDVEHAAQIRTLLNARVTNPEEAEQARRGAEQGLAALWALLDQFETTPAAA